MGGSCGRSPRKVQGFFWRPVAGSNNQLLAVTQGPVVSLRTLNLFVYMYEIIGLAVSELDVFCSFRFWLACEQLKATPIRNVPSKAQEIFK